MRLGGEVALAWADDAATLALLQDRELTSALLTDIKAIDFPGNLGMLPQDERGRQVFDAMRCAVAALPDVPETVFMDNLAADFAAIYLTGALDASPCESFWVSDEHLVCQEAMFELRQLYADDGLAVPDWRKRPDDHLVFQLQFLARRLGRLATETADGIAGADRDQWRSLAAFLDRHLLRWLPDFAGRVATRCDTEFYAALLLLTDAWCQHLRDLIALHLGEPRPSMEEVEAMARPQHLDNANPEPVRFMPGSGGLSW